MGVLDAIERTEVGIAFNGNYQESKSQSIDASTENRFWNVEVFPRLSAL